MSSPVTVRGWSEAFEIQAEDKIVRGIPSEIDLHGIDEQSLTEWAVWVGASHFLPLIEEYAAGGRAREDAMASVMAAGILSGFELGLWMARTGRVTPDA